MTKPISKKKVIILMSLLFLGLTGLRFGWIYYYQTPDHPRAEHGMINLSDWEFNDKDAITLDGEWDFYPDQFINPTSDVEKNTKEKTHSIEVPSSWSELNKPSENHGTYRLQIELPANNQPLYGLRLQGVYNAADIYVNGKLIKKYGELGSSKLDSQGEVGPFSTYFSPDSDVIDLMIHVANYETPSEGGMTESIQFGTDTAISSIDNHSQKLQLTVSIIYILHSLYALALFFMGRDFKQKELLFYALMLIIAGFTTLIDDDMVIHLPVSIEFYDTLLNFLFASVAITLLTSIKYLLNIKSKLFSFLVYYYVILSIGLILTYPFPRFFYIGIGGLFFYLLTLYFLFTETIKVIQKGEPEGIYVLIFITAYTSNIVWGSFINIDAVEIPFYPIDFIIYVVAIALLLLHRYMESLKTSEVQAAALKEADQKKDEFLANTSHELRNPLHSVINISQSILRDSKEELTYKSKENLELILQIGQHMRFTLNDILDVTQIEEKQIYLNPENVNLRTTASVVIDMLEFMVEGKDVTVSLSIPNDFPEVYVDKNRLIQILFNLIHNALKFTHAGKVTISATYQRDTAKIFVQDTGTGINEELQHKIFQPYEQEDASITSVGGGIGLGLHVCKQLVELHGGALYFESIPNEGTTFTFTLPLVSMALRDAAPTKENIIKTKGMRPVIQSNYTTSQTRRETIANILVVDDDPINLRIIEDMLDLKYHITTSTNGHEALRLINSNDWDLLISDVMMPTMSGYELSRLVRKQYSIAELPILLLTARYQAEDIEAGFRSGANDYVAKPVESVELTARVDSLIHLKLSIQEQLRIEAAWLQAQIRPHFLFNTLNTIASLSDIDSERMTELLNHFGNYLRRSFDVQNTNSLIPIEEELELVHSYIYIEKERFGDRLLVNWSVDEDINVKLPPLSIQPLVENAIHHGILKQVEGGIVQIKVRESDTYIQVKIVDNGVGMRQEKANKFLSDTMHEGNNVGIINTNKRLKKLFNKGLDIITAPHEGMIVQFKIPKK